MQSCEKRVRISKELKEMKLAAEAHDCSFVLTTKNAKEEQYYEARVTLQQWKSGITLDKTARRKHNSKITKMAATISAIGIY